MKSLTLLLAIISVPAFSQQMVSFECSGNVTAMSQSNNDAPAFQAHIQGFIDDAEVSMRFSGVLIATPDRAGNAPLLERELPLKRCSGDGMMSITATTDYTSQITLEATSARLWIDRGNQRPIKVGVAETASGTPEGYTIVIEGISSTAGGTPEG